MNKQNTLYSLNSYLQKSDFINQMRLMKCFAWKMYLQPAVPSRYHELGLYRGGFWVWKTFEANAKKLHLCNSMSDRPRFDLVVTDFFQIFFSRLRWEDTNSANRNSLAGFQRKIRAFEILTWASKSQISNVNYSAMVDRRRFNFFFFKLQNSWSTFWK